LVLELEPEVETPAQSQIIESIPATPVESDIQFAAGIPSEPVSSVNDFEIPGRSGNIPIRLYVPQVKKPLLTAAPTLICYHEADEQDTHDSLLRTLANRAQCIVISVKYRTDVEDDAWTALKWFADYAFDIGADSERIAVAGVGPLVAQLAQKAAATALSLRLQILIYTSLDATILEPAQEQQTKRHLSGILEWFEARLSPKTEEYIPEMLPDTLKHVAPALIVSTNGKGQEYAKRLSAANVPVEQICPAEVICKHSQQRSDNVGALVDRTAAALRSAFKHQ
jgi:acetyl esterase